MVTKIAKFFRHGLVQNAISLSGVQAASYVIPLVTIPYLARVLGAAGWGLVAFAQAFGAYLALLGEYGFALSATREVARHRGDRERLTEIVAGVLGAKLLLTSAIVAVGFLAVWVVPAFRRHPLLLWSAVFWAVAQAFSMMWFFLGLEEVRVVAWLDVAAKAAATIAIFFVVRRVGDEWRVLALQGLGFFLSFVICTWLTYRKIAFRLPNWRTTSESIRMGWTMFLYRSSVSLYTAGNAFILGLFVAPTFVGYYAGAEKIGKALVSLLTPVTQTLYPRLSHLVHKDIGRAARLLKVILVVMAVGGAVAGACVFYGAPGLVHLILGNAFGPSTPVLRVFAWLPLVIGVGAVFGVYWMLPLGMDRVFNTVIFSAGALNLLLATLLAPKAGPVGMAWAVMISEICVTVSMGVYLMSRRLAFWNLERADGVVA